MRPDSLLLSALALAPAAVSQNVVEFGIHRGLPGVRLPLGSFPHLSPRAATYTQELVNNITGGGYFLDVSVGTPPQPLTMLIDTGSSDAWVLSPQADLCTKASLQLKYQDSCAGTYNNNKSETYKLVQKGGFTIRYLDGGVAKGDYISEDFSIAGTTIKDLQMGYVTQAVRGTGILGIGYSANVASDEVYPNLIDQFAAQKLIGVKAYSLYLNDRRSSSGSILFGGIDADKFTGTLNILPVIKSSIQPNYTAFEVAFTAMGVKYSNGSSADINPSFFSSGTVPAILDSGTTLSYFPSQLAGQVFHQLGAVTDDVETGLTFIDCKYLTQEPDLVFSFTFNGTTIEVPVSELVLDTLGPYQHLLPSSIPYDRTCMFGIQSTAGFDSSKVKDSSFALLGDTFLRSAYVVYDLEHNQIGMAQANWNSSQSNIIELKAGSQGLPTVTGVEKSSTTTGSGVATVTVTAPNAGPQSIRLSGGRDALAVLGITAVFGVLGAVLL
ncbi:aspartic peptidase domain-containing protein [Echria macrotheca]|uniref:Aspartic peptidase domain-containing protein n=1 Tax=Echria macrotheca TaxID=438768 RepID=A0AAJ0FEC7_9PEZI|nr:aspartic peptidase domain-containing protein [Echria macrotheca]